MKNSFLKNGQLAIIAEIASAHGGDIKNLKKLISSANNTGADFIKLQIYQFDQLVADENSKFQDLKKIEIKPKDWINVLDYAAKINANIIAEVFDRESFTFLRGRKEIHGFKIPTADIADTDFINLICDEQKTIFLGIGGATKSEIEIAVGYLSEYNEIDFVLLHGIQSFPTKVEDCLLNRITDLKKQYCCPIGYADHIDAEESFLAYTIPAMAVGLGASVIEKHITLDRSKKGYDYYSSLNPEEFLDFVNYLHTIKTSLGSNLNSNLTPAEVSYRNNMKKFAILESDISSGTPLHLASVIYKRTSTPGMTRSNVDLCKHQTAKRNFQAGHILQEENFE